MIMVKINIEMTPYCSPLHVQVQVVCRGEAQGGSLSLLLLHYYTTITLLHYYYTITLMHPSFPTIP